MLEKDQVAWRLEQGERLAEAGEFDRARACLEEILLPILARPRALEVWLRLIRLLEPEAERQLRKSLLSWVRTAQVILEERPSGSGPREPPSEGLLSRTLARLFWSQGHREEALRIYQGLLERDPQDQELLAEFRARLAEARGIQEAQRSTLLALEDWALRIQRRRDDHPASHPHRKSEKVKTPSSRRKDP